MDISIALDRRSAAPTPLRVKRATFRDTVGTWEFSSCEPPEDLRELAALLWSSRGRVRFSAEAILPRPGMELIVNLGADYAVTNRGSPPRQLPYRDAWLSPMQESPLVVVPSVVRPSFDTDLVAVTLRPGGAHALLGLPLGDLTNRVIELEDLLGPATVRALQRRLAGAPSAAPRFALLVAFLRALREASRARPSARVAEALEVIDVAPGEARVLEIARDLAVSPKHLRTLFEREVGLSPKRYARLVRFTGVIGEVAAVLAPSVDWAAVALRHGYFDQAHFAREFRAFAGVTPTEYLRARTPDGTTLVDRG